MAWSYNSSDLTPTTDAGRLKTCNSCKLEKPNSSFHKNISSKDGLRSFCKSCKNERDKDYRETNPEKIQKSQSKYYGANKEIFFAHNAKRQAKNKEATPSWLTDGQKAHIKRFYKLSRFMQEVTGTVYHVDHIVPLNGKNVCGLNVPWNLRVIPAKDNLIKSNKFEEQE